MDSKTRTRAILGLSLVGAGVMTAVSLLQTGVISHLPDPPPRGWFDSDRVNLSNAAFRFGVPDGVLALGSYLANVPLALLARRRRWLWYALTAKVTVDALGAFKYTLIEMPKVGVACAYCIVAAGASFTILGLAIQEARTQRRASGRAAPPSRPRDARGARAASLEGAPGRA